MSQLCKFTWYYTFETLYIIETSTSYATRKKLLDSLSRSDTRRVCSLTYPLKGTLKDTLEGLPEGNPEGHLKRHLKRHLRLHVNWGFAFFFSYGVPLGKPCKVPCRVAYNLQIKPLGSLSNQLYPSGIWPWHTPPPIRITRYLKSQTSQSTNRRILCQSIERLVRSLVRGFPGMRYD